MTLAEVIDKINNNPNDGNISNDISSLPRADQPRARKALATAKKAASGTNKAGQATNIATGAVNNFTEALVKMTGGLNDVNKAMMGTSGFFTQLTAVNKKIEEFRIGLNKLAVEDSRQFILSLRQQQNALRDYTVTYDTLIKVTTSFRNNLNELTARTYGQNADKLRAVTAINTKFGIETGESVRFLNNLNKGFNVSGRGADRFSRTLLNFARQTGQPFRKVFQDFNDSINNFFVTLDSGRAMQRFTVFQQVSRTLGTSVNSLLGVVDKFDDLQTGFQTGGELNMLLSSLGGSFDAQRAIMMSRPERLRYLAETVAGVGGQIRGMNELGQRAIIRQLAQTTGFDVGTIRQFIDKGVGGDIDKLIQRSQSLTAMTAEEQKRAADQLTTRRERQQIISDKLVNKNTVALERLTETLTKRSIEGQELIINKFTTAVGPILNSLNNTMGALNTTLSKGIEARVGAADTRRSVNETVLGKPTTKNPRR